MDFDENTKESKTENAIKNRKTLIALFVMFITPVILAYAAYFGGWYQGSSSAEGEIIAAEQMTDIEDYHLVKPNGEVYHGKEFETLYWWIVPLDGNGCNFECSRLNTFMVNQTYVGLGKEHTRANQLAILEKGKDMDLAGFPKAFSEFSSVGVKAKEKTHSGKDLDLPANYIYLVDPLGNILMRYPLVTDKDKAPIMSKKLRKDLLHLFKYARLG